MHGLFDFSKLFYYFRNYCLLNTPPISSICIRAHMHARLTWDPRGDLTHSRHVCKNLLWVPQISHMLYYMGSGALWAHMCQYWHLGPPVLLQGLAPRVEVLKMFFSCFEPELLLIKGLEALSCFAAKALELIYMWRHTTVAGQDDPSSMGCVGARLPACH